MAVLVRIEPRPFLKAVDPAHGRMIPAGWHLARALRQVWRRQLASVALHLRANPFHAPSLQAWTGPMAELFAPLLAPFALRGARASLSRVATRLRGRNGRGETIRRRDHGHLAASNVLPGADRQFSGSPGGATSGIPLGDGAEATRARAGHGGHRGRTAVLKADAPTLEFGFDVFNLRVLDFVRWWTYVFCDATNRTSQESVAVATGKLRLELGEGLEQGEAMINLTRRVQSIFVDPARAHMIAMSEASRAMHGGQLLAARDTGVVAGFQWLASSDACDLCLELDGKEVALDTPFAVDVGRGPYSIVLHPPRHPHCMCTVVETFT